MHTDQPPPIWWVKVFASSQVHLAEIIHGMLLDNDIAAVLVNKQASAYQMFGDVEVYVPDTAALKAYYLINENQL